MIVPTVKRSPPARRAPAATKSTEAFWGKIWGLLQSRNAIDAIARAAFSWRYMDAHPNS